MKLIKPKVEYIPQAQGLEGVYRQIERAGRTAYKSEDKITSDSAKAFVDKMIKAKHYAALEHGTVYLDIVVGRNGIHRNLLKEIKKNPYFHLTKALDKKFLFFTTNYRTLLESGRLKLLKYMQEKTDFIRHEKRYSFKITCSRAIAQQLTRHRVFSFLMESQRYCNYSKDKFDNQITCICPAKLNLNTGEYIINDDGMIEGDGYLKHIDDGGMDVPFLRACINAEIDYFDMLEHLLATPELARNVLPNATKTEIVMTGFASDWRYFFDLRYFKSTGKPDDDMLALAELLKEKCEKNNLWNDIMSYKSKFENLNQ